MGWCIGEKVVTCQRVISDDAAAFGLLLEAAVVEVFVLLGVPKNGNVMPALTGLMYSGQTSVFSTVAVSVSVLQCVGVGI